jgi:serine/threonine protein kinase
MENVTGKSLGRYQLIGLLDEGGMGEVYHAFDPVLKRDVAIKTIHPHLLRRPGFKERFLQEAVAAARLQHPGIVQVHDYGEAGDTLFIVMAFISGGNLQEMLEELRAKGQWVELRESVEIIQQISLAVNHAHRNGVLHRDIKPSNLMLAPEPCGGLPFRPILTDLGLSKLLEGGVETQTGLSMGTPAYMSPEQAKGLPVDVRSDVYSLGALLYHLCAGQPPFPAKSITEAMRIHFQELQLPAPRSLNPAIPPELEAVLLKALERDPDMRYADADQFAQALGNLLPTLLPPSSADRTVMDTAIATATSLATVLEQKQEKPRGKSVLEDFPREQPIVGTDLIQVLEPEKTDRTYPVRTWVITVGREAGNTIMLDDSKVSRHHLRIERKGETYTATDLGSSNGSYLGGVKLLKGVAEIWDPGQPLQVGGTYLKLVRTREVVVTQVDGVKSTMVSMDEGKPALRISQTRMTVEPGNSVPLELTILNQGGAANHYLLSVEGVPPDWVKNLPADPLPCTPGKERTITLLLQPPRSPQSRAGNHPLTVRAAGRAGPNDVATASATLTITPYRKFNAQLLPQKVRDGASARVMISNQGNAPETFQVDFQDSEEEIRFEPAQGSLEVAEGQSAALSYQARRRQRRLIGAEKGLYFSSTVHGQSGEAQPLQGELSSHAIFSGWVLAFVILSILACAVYSALSHGGIPNFGIFPPAGTVAAPVNKGSSSQPTYTPYPTFTPIVSSTAPASTYTPYPTYTAVATYTSQPANKAAPPTSTPAPAVQRVDFTSVSVSPGNAVCGKGNIVINADVSAPRQVYYIMVFYRVTDVKTNKTSDPYELDNLSYKGGTLWSATLNPCTMPHPSITSVGYVDFQIIMMTKANQTIKNFPARITVDF